MLEEIELHELVNRLQDKADVARSNQNTELSSLIDSWIDQVISGNAGIEEAKQMLKAVR